MKPDELKEIRTRASERIHPCGGETRMQIRVSMGTSGMAAGSRSVLQTFHEEIADRDLSDVQVFQTGERGWASCEPVAEVREAGTDPVFYSCLTADKARRIVQEHIVGGTPVAEYQIHPAG